MFSVSFVKHILECGVIVLHVLEEPLLGELWVGQGLCEGLDMGLLDVVGLGLITSEEVGVIKRVHTLFGGVRSVATALKVVEEVQEDVQELEGELEDVEARENGDQRRGRTTLHNWMKWNAQHLWALSHAMWCTTHECADANRTRLNRQKG